MVITGTRVEGSRQALALAKTRPDTLFSTAEVHPNNSAQCDNSTTANLGALTADEAIVAISDCGLDFNRGVSLRPVKAQWFYQQLELAAELGLTLFLHERDAHARFLAILREHRDNITEAFVHCFTGSPQQASAYLDLDLHIGVTGWVCGKRRGGQLREAVPMTPNAKLMFETEGPFLAPRDLRPERKRNEPECLPHIAATVANLKNISIPTFALKTTSTARTFFRPSKEGTAHA